MVNVPSTHLDISKRSDVVSDRCDKQPDGNKRNEETHGSEEKPLMWPVRDSLMDQYPEPRQVQHEQHHGNKNAYENEEYPCAGNVHSRHYALEGSAGILQSTGVGGENQQKGRDRSRPSHFLVTLRLVDERDLVPDSIHERPQLSRT